MEDYMITKEILHRRFKDAMDSIEFLKSDIEDLGDTLIDKLDLRTLCAL